MNEIRVFLAIEHPLVIQGLTAACAEQPDMRVVGEARDAQTLIKALPTATPDVVVHHARLPLSDRGHTIRDLYGPNQPWRSILLLPLNERVPLQRRYRGRVDAMLLANDLPQHVIRTIRLVMRGQSFVCPLLEATLQYRDDGMLPDAVSRLGETEQEVFRLINAFHTGSAVARRLGLTTAEVSDYRMNICEALHGPPARAGDEHDGHDDPSRQPVAIPPIRWETPPSGEEDDGTPPTTTS